MSSDMSDKFGGIPTSLKLDADLEVLSPELKFV